jgi:outer membrane protein assembly factor BamB
MVGRIVKACFAILVGVLALGFFPFQASALETGGGSYYQGSGEVYVQAGDWPSIHHDAANSGVLPEPMVAPREFRLKWSALQNASVLSSPVVGDDGRIYVTATQENFEPIEGWESGVLQSQLYALDAGTGAIIWRANDIMLGGMAGAPLLIRSPRGELSVVASGAGFVIAYDENGRVRWRSDMGSKEVSISAHLSPDGRSIFVGTDQGSVYLKDPATGKDLIPAYQDSDFINGNTPCMTADGSVILIGIHYNDETDGIARAVRPDISSGTWETLWTFEDIDGESQTSPTLSQDGRRVYIGDEDAAVIALDAESGEEIWRYDFDYITGKNYLACASFCITADGLIGIGLVHMSSEEVDSRLIEFFDEFGFILSRVMVGPFVSSFTNFFWGGTPRYTAILRDNGDDAEIAYMEDWKINGGVTYSAGSGLFYFAGMEEGPTGKLENIVVGLDSRTWETYTQPIENAYLNNISLADGALIVPIFWGGEMGNSMVTQEGFGVHYYEDATE